MDKLINGNIFMMASGAIFICTFIYSIVHIVYDIATKSDIEKCLTYRGKDRILSGLIMFIIIVLITMISTYGELIEANNEKGLFFAVI